MKSAIFIILFIFTCIQINAQEEADYGKMTKHAQMIVSLIKENKVNELAAYINYPLKRDYPIPAIKNAGEFVNYYRKIFGNSLIEALNNINNSKDEIIFEPGSSNYGVHNGDIWFSEDGKIITINYQSEKEIRLRDSLAEKVRSEMHPSVTKWTLHVLTGKTNTVLISIDRMPNEKYRYIAWNNPKKTSEKPDLLINDGDMEGTRWWQKYIFKNNEWKYVIEHDTILLDKKDTAWHLTVYKNEIEKLNTPIKVIIE